MDQWYLDLPETVSVALIVTNSPPCNKPMGSTSMIGKVSEGQSTDIPTGIVLQLAEVRFLSPHTSLYRSSPHRRRQLIPCFRATGESDKVAKTPGNPNLQSFAGKSLSSTEVEARLPFGHEVDSGASLGCVRNYARSDCGSPELTLLGAAPSVGMGQHELNIVRHRVPLLLSDFVGGDEESLGRIKEVVHEI